MSLLSNQTGLHYSNPPPQMAAAGPQRGLLLSKRGLHILYKQYTLYILNTNDHMAPPHHQSASNSLRTWSSVAGCRVTGQQRRCATQLNMHG